MHLTSKSVTTKLYTSIFNKFERYNFGHISQLSFEIKGYHPNSLFKQKGDISISKGRISASIILSVFHQK